MSDIIWTIGPFAVNANPHCFRTWKDAKNGKRVAYKQLWQNILIRFEPLGMRCSKPCPSDLENFYNLFNEAETLTEQWMDDKIDVFSYVDSLETLIDAVDFSQGRVLMGLEILLDNCTDPDRDYIEFSPEIRQGLWLRERVSWLVKLMLFCRLRPWDPAN
jgi:hypothetical protein